MTARTRLCEVAGLAVEYGEGEVALTCPGPPLVVRALQGLCDAFDQNELAFKVALGAARGVLTDGWRSEGAKRFELPPISTILLVGAVRQALPTAVQRAALWADDAGPLPEAADLGGLRVETLEEGERRYVVLRYEGAFYSRLPAPQAFVVAHALFLAAKKA